MKLKTISIISVSALLIIITLVTLSFSATITEKFYISENTVLLINGENFTVNWIPDDKIVCIKEINKTLTDPECSKIYINKSLDKTKTTTINGNLITLDKSYTLKLKNGLTYEFIYVDKQKTKCKCYKDGSCAVVECYPQKGIPPSGTYYS